MTDVIEMIDPVTGEIIDEQQLAEQLLKQAKEQGVDLVGPDGVLNGLTKRVVETALEAEMTEHLGYEKHGNTIAENARNGIRSKTVLPEVGPVEIDVPRDREGLFEPKSVKKRQRRQTGVDEIVPSLTARGLTTGEVAAHFDDVYGASVSKDTISRITDKVIEEMTEWQNRPLDRGKFLPNVAMLACVFGCDALFEDGYVAVQEGRVVGTSAVNSDSAIGRRVARLSGRTVAEYQRSATYFDWHRTHVFMC